MNTSGPWWKGQRGEWYVAMQVLLLGLVAVSPLKADWFPAWPPAWAGVARWAGVGVLVGAAVVFLAAALPKIADIPQFAKDVAAYQLAPVWSHHLVAMTLPWIELVVQDHGLLGGEVAEERALGDLRGLGDLLDRRLGVALGLEQAQGVLLDRRAGAGLLALTQAAGLVAQQVRAHGPIVPRCVHPLQFCSDCTFSLWW